MYDYFDVSAVAFIGSIIAAANFKTAKHILSTYSMEKAVFSLAFADATIEAVLGVAAVVAAACLHLYPGNLGSCTFTHTILFLFRVCGQLITVEIASIRY